LLQQPDGTGIHESGFAGQFKDILGFSFQLHFEAGGARSGAQARSLPG
jgi:hypothetical protein